MKKILVVVFLLYFPMKAMGYPNFSNETDTLAINMLNVTNMSISDSLIKFAVIAHNKEYDKAFYPIQECYKQSIFDDNQFGYGLAQCVGVDYSITRKVNQANQQAEQKGLAKPYNIPFFEWRSFENRIERFGISKKFVEFNAQDATMSKANKFSKTTLAVPRFSEYLIYIWLNYCPEKFDELVKRVYSIP